MPDAAVSIRKGESRKVYGSVTAATGTLTVSGTPTYTVTAPDGSSTTGNAVVSAAGPAAALEVYLQFATAGRNPGRYLVTFSIATTNGDTYLDEVEVEVEAVPPAPYGAYPTAADLQAFLEDAGFTLSAGVIAQLDASVRAGIRDLEKATDRIFLAAAATRRFNPPTNSQHLLLDQDLASLTSLSYGPATGTVVFVNGTDFTLEPWDAPARLLPYDTVVFADGHRWSYPLPIDQRGSIYIVGAWGYGVTIPENAWLAMLARGAWLSAPLLAQGLNDGVVEVQQKDTRTKWADDPLAAQKLVWGGKDGASGLYGSALAEYTRQPQEAPPAVRPFDTRKVVTAPSVFGVAPTVDRSRWRRRGFW